MKTYYNIFIRGVEVHSRGIISGSARIEMPGNLPDVTIELTREIMVEAYDRLFVGAVAWASDVGTCGSMPLICVVSGSAAMYALHLAGLPREVRRCICDCIGAIGTSDIRNGITIVRSCTYDVGGGCWQSVESRIETILPDLFQPIK